MENNYPSQRSELVFHCPENSSVVMHISGDWIIGNTLPSVEQVKAFMNSNPSTERVQFNTDALTEWDSRFLNFLIKVTELCHQQNIKIENQGLPSGVQSLIKLASAVPERKEAQRRTEEQTWIARVGDKVTGMGQEAKVMVNFVGEVCLVLFAFIRGKAQYRGTDLGMMIEECGPRALPIVTLISVLVGLILAFIGAVQLNMFGAQIYVANLVGLGMTREMGAMMTAVIMAGRTGAAFAAQLGTMQVNEEIDALKTMGISPMEFLVLPRLLALILMLPLLCLYADFMGILGGFIVAVTLLDLSLIEYYHQTIAAMGLNDFSVGLIKSVIFGVLVAISGCLRGMQCGKSSAAVGAAATSAVVTAIVAIVVADAIMTLIYDAIGI